jgi:hypothetical protein
MITQCVATLICVYRVMLLQTIGFWHWRRCHRASDDCADSFLNYSRDGHRELNEMASRVVFHVSP